MALAALLALLLVLALTALAFGAWLVGTESGARTALPMLLDRTGGAVKVTGVHGRLIGPLRIEHIVIERTNDRIALSDVRVDWHPRALLQQRTLHVKTLHARRLAIVGRVDQTPEPAATLPDDLTLPIAVSLDELRLDGGEVRRGPATLVTLGPLVLGLVYEDQQYRLDLQRFGASPELDTGTADAGISGTLKLSAQRPYPLTGHFDIASRARFDERALGARGMLALTGSLAELHANLDLLVNDAPVTGVAVLRPFSEQVLGAAQLQAKALNLAALDAELPRTALDFDLNAGEDGAGQLRVRNAAPGAVQEQRLPLTAFDLAFRQRPDGIEFERIRMRIGNSPRAERTAGELSGSGRYVDGALTLSLHTEALNLQRIDARLRATRLAGSLEVRHADGKQEFELALSEPFGTRRITLDAHGVLADAELAIRRAELRAGDGRLQVSGHAALEGAQAFRAEGEVSHFRLHDFGRFEQVPKMDLNGKFALNGARSPRLQADIDFTISNSRLADQPLAGNGIARIRDERLEIPQLALVSGANRLNAQGQLANGDADLKFSLHAPQLGQLGAAFGGALFVDGVASGTLDRATIDAEWRAERARLPGDLRIASMQGHADLQVDREAPFMLRAAEAAVEASGLRRGEQQLDRIDARLRFAPQANAPLALDLDAHGVAAGQAKFERVTLSIDGTNARHVLQADLKETNQSWSLRAAGGLSAAGTAGASKRAKAAPIGADWQWEGSIEAFEARGRIDARMGAPAPLQLSRERVSLERLQLAIDGGQVVLDRFVRDPNGIDTRGRIVRLQIAQFLRYAEPEPPLKTDLELAGEWDLRYRDTVTGSLTLRRESGDVTMLGSAPVTLGLDTLQADANVNDGRLALKLRADGRRLGNIALNADTRIGDDGNPFALAPGAPLNGSARVAIPSLAWIAPLVTPALVADGQLQGNITLAGTVDKPSVSGRINGDALRVAHADFGLDLRKGTLRAEFKDDQLLLQGLTFEEPQGRISLSGPVDLSDGVAANLLLRAERFALLNRPDRRLVLSGDSRISWQKERAMVIGDFTVNSGFFDIGQADRPTLADDVVIVGQEERRPGGMAAAIDVTVRLGDGVVVRGRGLDALLGGEARLLSDAGQMPHAEGTLRVLKGTYSAYGRALAIEQGELRFTGPLNNPALDILAMRRGQEVEAGVSVGGTVLAPRVTLVSEPPAPDAEKLAWLVLGRSLASAGAAEIGSLQTAAAALLAQSAAAGVQSRIASAFGLDTFSVGTTNDNLQQRIVTLGKQISTRLYLGYQHGLESAASVVQLRYLLTPTLSLEAEAGARSALSLFYNITFD